MDEKSRMEIGLFRYGVISPLVGQGTAKNKEAFFREAASKEYKLPDGKQVYFKASTIKDWYLKYNKEGFQALLPNQRIDLGQSRALTPEMTAAIGEIKKEFPYITGQKTWEKMIERGVITATDVSVDTVQRYIKNNGLKAPAAEDPHLPFEFPHVNDCWQTDTVDGPSITDLAGNSRQTYLITILDDHSRKFLSGKFYYADNAVNMQHTMKLAVKIGGIPKMLLMDHGGSYDNLQFKAICAELGIGSVYCAPYKPEGKGKEERSHRTVNMRFMTCTDFKDCHSLEDLNAKFENYVASDYCQYVNRMTHQTPQERFMAEYESLRFMDAEKVDFIFLHREVRRLYSDSTIQFNNCKYEVPQEYIAGMKNRKEKIPIRFNPEDTSELYIVDPAQYKILYTLKKTDLNANTKRSRKRSIDFTVAGAE